MSVPSQLDLFADRAEQQESWDDWFRALPTTIQSPPDPPSRAVGSPRRERGQQISVESQQATNLQTEEKTWR